MDTHYAGGINNYLNSNHTKYLAQLCGQWRRSQVKSGGINIEKIEGVGSGEGLCPPQLGVWGLAPRKKSILH